MAKAIRNISNNALNLSENNINNINNAISIPEVSPAADNAGSKSNIKAANKSNIKNNDMFVLQSGGNEYTMSDIKELCKAAYKNGTKKQIKSIRIYVKSEDSRLRAYYVVNDKPDGSFIDL